MSSSVHNQKEVTVKDSSPLSSNTQAEHRCSTTSSSDFADAGKNQTSHSYHQHIVKEDESSTVEQLTIREWFRTIEPHAKVELGCFFSLIFAFLVSHEPFYLRFIPLIAVAKVFQIFLVWAMFWGGTPEARLIRDTWYVLGLKVRQGVRVDVYTVAVPLGVAHKYKDWGAKMAGNFFGSIDKKRKEARDATHRFAIETFERK